MQVNVIRLGRMFQQENLFTSEWFSRALYESAWCLYNPEDAKVESPDPESIYAEVCHEDEKARQKALGRLEDFLSDLRFEEEKALATRQAVDERVEAYDLLEKSYKEAKWWQFRVKTSRKQALENFSKFFDATAYASMLGYYYCSQGLGSEDTFRDIFSLQAKFRLRKR